MKWKTLHHNGVCFPPLYESKGLGVAVRGVGIPLGALAEEMAWAWAKKKDTPYVKDPVFAANFLKDFLKELPPEFRRIGIEDVDFSEFNRFQEAEKLRDSDPVVKKQLSGKRKEEREHLKSKYGYALVNGKKYEIQNWMVEPPGLFIGRGNHPLRGRWKPRVEPAKVTLNLSDGGSPPSEHPWKAVHNHESTWLARWEEKLTKVMKYVWLHDSSDIRQQRDRLKYENAIRLEHRINRVSRYINRGMRSRDPKTKKVATVAYLINMLAMRVGDEKDEDEADTVGASTLRVEHVKLGIDRLEFDFLGKDSVRWQKTLFVDSDKVILENFQRFINGKGPRHLIFDGISSEQVNRFLGGAMPGLTAKVFRTYHATSAVRGYLKKHAQFSPTVYEVEKLFHARRANLDAAVKCNHKRTPPKNWEETLAKKERLRSVESQTPKTEKQAQRRQVRIRKLELEISLAKETRDYNLNTSLRNYIDPRVYKSWSEHVGFDWTKIYTKSLQRKFQWANRARLPWVKVIAS